jgi:hypothetical protein
MMMFRPSTLSVISSDSTLGLRFAAALVNNNDQATANAGEPTTAGSSMLSVAFSVHHDGRNLGWAIVSHERSPQFFRLPNV